MQLEFPARLRARMRRELAAAGWREIGGILMAKQFSPGHFRLADFSVDSETGGAAHFVRSPEHHKAALDSFFERTDQDFERYNYLGEWHSHPSFSAKPSAEDIGSMLSLVEGEQSIDFSVLLVVRLRWKVLLECSAMLFQRGGYVSGVELV